MFPAWEELDDFKRGWFSSHLQAAKEEPLVPIHPTETHRFIWLRSFHHPVVIRAHCDSTCNLTTKVLSGAGGYGPGAIAQYDERTLDNEEERTLRDSLSAAKLWDGQPETDVIGLDGAQWIFESRVGDRYIAWNVWSPGYDNAQYKEFVELCLYLLDLSELEIPSNELY